MRKRAYFGAYHAEREYRRMAELSSQFFAIADHLNLLARENGVYDKFNCRSFGYASVVLYVSAVEAFLNEQLTIATSLRKDKIPARIIESAAKIKDMTIHEAKINDLCSLYTGESNIDMAFARGMLALVDARNEIIHYTPVFDDAPSLWPQRLEFALRDAGVLPSKWGLWTQVVVDTPFLNWARETTKSFLMQFNAMVGGVDPFGPSTPDHMRWAAELRSTPR